MENTLIKLDAPELQVIEKSKAEAIRAIFEPMVTMLQEFEDAYNSIVNASSKEITKELTNAAKRLRIDIGKVRIETEKVRKEQKEEYLRAGKAIDGVSNILKWAVTDKENRLKEIEDYFEIQEQERLEKLQSDRAAKLSKYVEDADERNLASMDDDVWNAYFATKKGEYEDRIDAERKAEAERKENERLDKLENSRRLEVGPYTQFNDKAPELRMMEEKDYQDFLTKLRKAKSDYDNEQARIRKENERIRKEQEEERKKVEAERRTRDEKERKEREAFEAKLKKEREERQKAEAEIRAKKEAEEVERKLGEEEKRKAELAPDKDKLLSFAARLEQIEIPKVDSNEADQILASAISAVTHTAKTIRNLVNERLK